MKILVVGAGATGGYFGGRLLAAGRDVTFLVRAGRAARLAEIGLRVHSPFGDLQIAAPPTVVSGRITAPVDLVVLSCKAYDLDSAMADFAPAVGSGTVILPLLNGMRHLDALDAHFGKDRVLGGECRIAATVNAQGEIEHLNQSQHLAWGERAGGSSARVKAIAAQMAGAGFEAVLSPDILQEMWEKWVFLACLAGGNCLLRGSVGEIEAAPGGTGIMLRLVEECTAIAAAAGHAPRAAFLEHTRAQVTQAGSPFTTSMLRDMRNGARIEADHVIGDLVRRQGEAAGASLLAVVYASLKIYEAQRAAA